MKATMISLIMGLTLMGCQRAPDGKAASPVTNDRKQLATSSTQEAQKPPQQPHLIALDQLITFNDPSLCYLDDSGERLLDGLHKYGDGQPITLGKVVAPEPYLSAFGSPTLHELRAPEMQEGEESVMEVRLPVKASWHSLTMIGIESQRTNFSDAWAYRFIFAEPFEKVRSALNRSGFAFSSQGKQAPGNSETAPTVELTQEGKQTSLDCWF